jgi:hypothetical protein
MPDIIRAAALGSATGKGQSRYRLFKSSIVMRLWVKSYVRAYARMTKLGYKGSTCHIQPRLAKQHTGRILT